MRTILLVLFSSLMVSGVFAQANKTENTNTDHHDHHDHHNNEIGVANSAVYFMNENVIVYGLHFHYIHNISTSKFGLGLGYERIFDKHKHNTLGIVGSYRPIDELSINISPGLTLEDKSETAKFALHIETSYELEFKNFHFGPAVEIAYDPEDYHLSLGIHIGYGF